MRLLFFMMIIFISACGISNKLSHENLSSYYDTSQNELNPSATIYHYSKDSSRCFYQIPFADLLSVNNGTSFTAKLKVHYELFTSYVAKSFVDSGTVAGEFSSADSLSLVKGSFDFPLTMEKEAVIKLSFIDVNRKMNASKLISIKKNTVHDAQSYLIKDESNNLIYQNYLSPGTKFIIETNIDSASYFYVRCYFHRYPFALPPFKNASDYIFDYAADSVFSVNKKDVSKLNLQRYGFYFFQSDTTIKKGVTVFIFGNEYPLITKAEELIEPTRYLTTQKEFMNLVEAKNKKVAADQFWLTLAGDEERARDAIKIYYSRTQDANYWFSSYMEGWKTDRGMIYIIFGTPRNVYRDEFSETWTYFTNPGTPELIFTFKKMGNPFTDQDYSLIREPSYESIWFLTVDQWRQGRIVNNNE